MNDSARLHQEREVVRVEGISRRRNCMWKGLGKRFSIVKCFRNCLWLRLDCGLGGGLCRREAAESLKPAFPPGGYFLLPTFAN